jgi:uncharacterized protein (TIGR03790 family)
MVENVMCWFCIAQRSVAQWDRAALRRWRHRLRALAAAGWLAVAMAPVGAQPAAGPAASPVPPPAPPPVLLAPLPQWITAPIVEGRLRAADIGLVINTEDPYSVAVGAHYIRARGLKPRQVLRLALPTRPVLTPEDFERLRAAVDRRFGKGTQALALAWMAPYAVACNSLTGALALGFDAALCQNSCAPSRVSPVFNSPSARPFTDHGVRLSMLLAADTVEAARALIDRGVAADGSLPKPGEPPAQALMLETGDRARAVRQRLYPPGDLLRAQALQVRVRPAAELPGAERLLLAQTGSVRVNLTPPPQWLPGGLGDHLTSFGGALLDAHDQSTALEWIYSGATASHGAVSEPCNHLQKFPHPQVLLLHYLQGSTAIEAYWKSVAWPQQSLFVGEPLAAPYASE